MLRDQSSTQFARQQIAVTPGETLTLWGWVKTDSVTRSAEVEFGSQTLRFTGTADYQAFVIDVTVPDGVTNMELTLRLLGTGTGIGTGTANFDYIHIE